MNRNGCLFGAIVLIALGAALYGQSTFGTIRGQVTDENGAAIPGVPVTLTNQDTGVVRKASSNEAGFFEFPDLVPGTYRLEASRQGFKLFVQRDIDLSARQTIRLDPVMKVGAVTESVTVTATPGLIPTDTASISGAVRGGEVFFLSPSSTSQRPWELMRLDPLVQNTASSTRFTMAGAYFNQSEFQIDGISAPLGTGRIAGSMVMSSEALQEVSIQAVNNSAEYASPAVFQQISKGGGNVVHGDVFWHYDTSRLNARAATSLAKPVNHNNYFGGNLGGPVILPGLYDGRNRTFFSLSWQPKRSSGSRTYLANVPTRDMRAGVFTRSIRDPLNGQFFADMTVPANRVNSISRKIQDTYFPEPTTVGLANNFQLEDRVATTREEVMDLRLDHNFNSRHWMFGRGSMTQFNNRLLDANVPSIGFTSNTRKLYTGVVSYTFTVRPSLLNELRAGFMRDKDPGGGPNNGLKVIQELGIRFPADMPPPDTRGFPRIEITDAQTLFQQNLVRSGVQSLQLTDTVSWIKGRHTIKTGLNVFAEQSNKARVPTGAHGLFRFQATYTLHSYADFLLGIPTQTRVVGISPGQYMRNTNYGLFVQDEFKLHPNLTLSLGLRWDYQGPIFNKNNGLYNFDPATGALVKAAPGTPVNSAFQAANPKVQILEQAAVGWPERTLRFADKNNFAPRIGFAWRPLASQTFAIRGGWGKFTDVLGQGVIDQFSSGGFLSRGDLLFDNPRPVANVMPNTAWAFPYPFPSVYALEAAAPLTVQGFNPRLANPYVQQWSLSADKTLFNVAFRASYVGTKSTNLVWRRDINQRTVAGLDSSRPYAAAGLGSIIQYMENGGSQIYHGLQLKSTRRFERGLMFQAGYVWGNNISDVIDGGDNDFAEPGTDARDRSIDRGRIGYNRKHNLTGFLIWELPFGKGHRLLGKAPGWLNQLVSGWELYPQFFAGSGQWFSPQRSGNNPFTAQSGETARADRIGDGNDGPKFSGSTASTWFNTSAFTRPPDDRHGTAGRNILEGPGFWSLHAGLTKKVRFGERSELWLGMTAQNVLNHPNWRSPTGAEATVASNTFGTTTTLLGADRGAVATSRQMMLRARIVF